MHVHSQHQRTDHTFPSRGSLGSTWQLPPSPQPSAAAAPAEWGGKANDEQLRQEVLHAEHRGAQEDPCLARAV